MIEVEPFVGALRDAGFRLFSGVPCSYLTPLINFVIDAGDLHYIPAVNEGDAVAIACGSRLGGMGSVVMFQNSGLGNAVSPLTSLSAVFRLPVLIVTTWRGQPDGPSDEVQHELMGRITPRLLQLMDIPYEYFPQDEAGIGPAIERAVKHMDSTGLPYALVMCQGAVADYQLQTGPDSPRRCEFSTLPSGLPTSLRFEPDDVLRTIQQSARSNDIVLATTGYTGRALYALADRPNQLYMVGSMGCVSSFGLGLAKAQPDYRVIVVDGDGSFLMRMGALAVLGHEKPSNFLHIVLDNGVYDSTGRQSTVSAAIDLPSVAAACGYSSTRRVTALAELTEQLLQDSNSPALLHVRTNPRADRGLPRPSINPVKVSRRLQNWMGVNECVMSAECGC